MSGSNIRSLQWMLSEAHRLEHGGSPFAARLHRNRLLDSAPPADLVAAARAAPAWLAGTVATLIGEVMVRRVAMARREYRPGDVARTLLSPHGLNVDARVVEYRALIDELLPGLEPVAGETTLRHRIAAAVRPVDVRAIARSSALKVIAGLEIEAALVELREMVDETTRERRLDELAWLDPRLARGVLRAESAPGQAVDVCSRF